MSTREETNEILIEIVDSVPSMPAALDMDIDVSNLEIVFESQNYENSSLVETETLDTAQVDIHFLKDNCKQNSFKGS